MTTEALANAQILVHTNIDIYILTGRLYIYQICFLRGGWRHVNASESRDRIDSASQYTNTLLTTTNTLNTLTAYVKLKLIFPQNRVLQEDLLCSQFDEKCPSIYGSPWLLATADTANRGNFAHSRWVKPTTTHPVSVKSDSLFSQLPLGLLSDLLISRFQFQFSTYLSPIRFVPH